MESSMSLTALIAEGRRLNSCLDAILSPPEDAPADVDDDVDMCSTLLPLCVPDEDSKADDSDVAGHQLGSESRQQAGGWRQRVPLLPVRIAGRLLEVKGKFGWIWPDRPIGHPDASLHEGKIYLSHRDVDAELPGVGAHVSFLLYADGSGLGAMSCRPAEGKELEPAPGEWLPPAPAPGGGAAPGAAPPPGPAPAASAAPAAPGAPGAPGAPASRGPRGFQAAPRAEAGQEPRAAAVRPRREPRTVAPPTSDARLAARAASLRPAEAPRPEGPGRRQEGPSRPPAKRPAEGRGRIRAAEAPVTGYVKSWKGSYGWVEPLEAVRHPLFNGKIFLHVNDMASPEPPEVGAKVVFLLYADPDGLGAEHCTLHKSSAAPEERQPQVIPTAVASAIGGTGVSASGLLAGATQSTKLEPRSAYPNASRPIQPSPQPQLCSLASAVLSVESSVQESQTIPNVDQDMAKRLAAWMEDREG